MYHPVCIICDYCALTFARATLAPWCDTVVERISLCIHIIYTKVCGKFLLFIKSEDAFAVGHSNDNINNNKHRQHIIFVAVTFLLRAPLINQVYMRAVRIIKKFKTELYAVAKTVSTRFGRFYLVVIGWSWSVLTACIMF